jgi:hypothetical protein
MGRPPSFGRLARALSTSANPSQSFALAQPVFRQFPLRVIVNLLTDAANLNLQCLAVDQLAIDAHRFR